MAGKMVVPTAHTTAGDLGVMWAAEMADWTVLRTATHSVEMTAVELGVRLAGKLAIHLAATKALRRVDAMVDS